MPENKDLADLFAERSLWELYRQSRAFYYNRFNFVVSIATGILIAGFAVVHFARLGTTSSNRVDFSALFSTWANDGFTYGATILGFLLAGFAVLFAVLRPHTVIALRQITRPGEQLYELKLIFVAVGYLLHSGDPYRLWSASEPTAAHLTRDLYGTGSTTTACCTRR